MANYLISNLDFIVDNSSDNLITAQVLYLVGGSTQSSSTEATVRELVVSGQEGIVTFTDGLVQELQSYTDSTPEDLVTLVYGLAVECVGNCVQVQSTYGEINFALAGNAGQSTIGYGIMLGNVLSPYDAGQLNLSYGRLDPSAWLPMYGNSVQSSKAFASMDIWHYELDGRSAQSSISHGSLTLLFEGAAIQSSVAYAQLTVDYHLYGHAQQSSYGYGKQTPDILFKGLSIQSSSIRGLIGVHEDMPAGRSVASSKGYGRLILYALGPMPISTTVDIIEQLMSRTDSSDHLLESFTDSVAEELVSASYYFANIDINVSGTRYSIDAYDLVGPNYFESKSAIHTPFASGEMTPDKHLHGESIQAPISYADLFLQSMYLRGRSVNLSKARGYVVIIAGHSVQNSSVRGKLVLQFQTMSGSVIQKSETRTALSLKEKLLGHAVQTNIVFAAFYSPLPVGRCVNLSLTTGFFALDIHGDCHHKSYCSGKVSVQNELVGNSDQRSSSLGALDFYPVAEVVGNAVQLSLTDGIAQKDRVLVGRAIHLSETYGKYTIEQENLWGDASQLTVAYGDNIPYNLMKAIPALQTSYIFAKIGVIDELSPGLSVQLSVARGNLLVRADCNGDAVQKEVVYGSLQNDWRSLVGNSDQLSVASGYVGERTYIKGMSVQNTRAYADLEIRDLHFGFSVESSLCYGVLIEYAYMPAGHVQQINKAVGNARDSSIGWIDKPSLILYEPD